MCRHKVLKLISGITQYTTSDHIGTVWILNTIVKCAMQVNTITNVSELFKNLYDPAEHHN